MNDNINLALILKDFNIKVLPELVNDIMQPAIQDTDFILGIKTLYQYAIKCDAIITDAIQTQTGDELVIKQGFQLLWQIRSIFATPLQFVIAASNKKNQLYEKTYDQEELFSNIDNFRLSFSHLELQLKSALESITQGQLSPVSDNSLLGQWDKIIKYAFIPENSYDTNDYITGYKIDNKGHKRKYIVYHKKEADTNVYVRWKTINRKRTLQHYYNLNISQNNIKNIKAIDGMLAYDKGWLYQWIKINNSILLDDGDQPLKSLMSKSFRENIPGIRGGDYGIQQLKYQNRRIMTFNNLKDILEGHNGYRGLIPTLQNFLDNNQTNIDTIKYIIQDFTTNTEYEQIVQDLDSISAIQEQIESLGKNLTTT